MGATELLNKRRWRHHLANRKINFSLFWIPKAIVDTCDIESKTKRKVRIELSNGKKLRGFMSITSGTELYFPVKIQKHLKSADWFICEIVGNKKSNQATIDWEIK
jgi:hypothetical protein